MTRLHHTHEFNIAIITPETVDPVDVGAVVYPELNYGYCCPVYLLTSLNEDKEGSKGLVETGLSIAIFYSKVTVHPCIL